MSKNEHIWGKSSLYEKFSQPYDTTRRQKQKHSSKFNQWNKSLWLSENKLRTINDNSLLQKSATYHICFLSRWLNIPRCIVIRRSRMSVRIILPLWVLFLYSRMLSHTLNGSSKQLPYIPNLVHTAFISQGMGMFSNYFNVQLPLHSKS